MLLEIGLVLAFYSIARLLPAKMDRVRPAVNALALLVATATAIDLTHRAFFDKSLMERLAAQNSQPPDSTATPNIAKAAPPKSKPSITRADGGPITTNLGYGFAVAKNSTLRREWIAVDYSDMPMRLEGTPGITTAYVSKEYSGEYRYRTKAKVKTASDISAYEVRFLTFDVWGNHVRTLSLSNVIDIPANSEKDLDGAWNLYSENEVEEHYASIAFIAKVRLKDGRVVAAPLEAVIEEARKFSAKFAEKDVEPAAPTKGT